MTLSQYISNSFWGPRYETPEALAERFNELIDHLSAIDPVFGNWIWSGRQPEPIAFEAIRNRLAERIAAAVARDDYGEPDPHLGYGFSVLSSLETTPRSVNLRVFGGSWAKGSFYSNVATIETGWRVEPDAAIVTYRIFRAALLASAECFDVTFGSAYPSDLGNLWPTSLKFHFGWINYISPRFAPLVMPPKSAIMEYRPNGGLLMAATDETFVTANPQHLAVARDIEAALAPLNALPWPLDEEPDHAAANP